MPGLAGGRGTYVIPWKSVPEMFKLTVHDRALHEAICEAPDFSPRQIRMAALRVAQLGLAGRDASGAAWAHLQREDNLELVARFFLTLRIVERMATEPLTLAELGTTPGQKKAGRILSGIAGALGCTYDDLHERIDVWSKTVCQVGLTEMPAEAMARKLINRLKPLGDQFLEWGKGETEDQIDGAADARLASDIARETWRLATEYATDIDATVKQPAESLRNWNGTLRATERTVHKLLWILDGWEQVVKLWDQAAHRPREE